MKQTWILFWKGVLIGAAFIVPGVSGGTMALITGLYSPFISALSSIKPAIFFNRKEFLKFWSLFSYLIPPAVGTAVGFFLLVRLLTLILQTYPEEVYCFFSGLIFASMPFLLKEMRKGKSGWIVFVFSSAFIFSFSLFPSVFVSGYGWLFFSVFLASTAMLLPGVSGSYILVIMGTYPVILNDLSVFSWRVVLYGFVGILSLALSARWIRFALEKYQQTVMTVLAGMALGGGIGIFPIKSKKALMEGGTAGIIILLLSAVLVFLSSKIWSRKT